MSWTARVTDDGRSIDTASAVWGCAWYCGATGIDGRALGSGVVTFGSLSVMRVS